jgi:hypothetical protein
MSLVGSVTCVVGWDVCGTLCFCVVVMPCRLCLAIAFWGCRGWVAVGGIGEGNTRSASLYNESNLNKLNVLFFRPPPSPTALQPRIGDSQFHRRWILLIAQSIRRTKLLCLGPLVVEIRDPAKFYTRRVAAQPKPQWQTTTVSLPSWNKMAKLLHPLYRILRPRNLPQNGLARRPRAHRTHPLHSWQWQPPAPR